MQLDHIQTSFYTREIKLIAVLVITGIMLSVVPVITNYAKQESAYSYSEAGYLVTKTIENKFYYEIVGYSAYPQFKDEFYLTVFVDDNYIKFRVPKEVFNEFNLGYHMIMYRKFNPTSGKYSDYSCLIRGIKVPAIIVEG